MPLSQLPHLGVTEGHICRARAAVSKHTDFTRTERTVVRAADELLVYVQVYSTTTCYHRKQVGLTQPRSDSCTRPVVEQLDGVICQDIKRIEAIGINAEEVVKQRGFIGTEDESSIVAFDDGYLYLIGEVTKLPAGMTEVRKICLSYNMQGSLSEGTERIGILPGAPGRIAQ
jgi:hypothetical protein